MQQRGRWDDIDHDHVGDCWAEGLLEDKENQEIEAVTHVVLRVVLFVQTQLEALFGRKLSQSQEEDGCDDRAETAQNFDEHPVLELLYGIGVLAFKHSVGVQMQRKAELPHLKERAEGLNRCKEGFSSLRLFIIVQNDCLIVKMQQRQEKVQ